MCCGLCPPPERELPNVYYQCRAERESRLPQRESDKVESLAEPSQAQLAKAANAKAERGEMRQAALAGARLNVEASRASLERLEAELDAEDAAVA